MYNTVPIKPEELPQNRLDYTLLVRGWNYVLVSLRFVPRAQAQANPERVKEPCGNTICYQESRASQ